MTGAIRKPLCRLPADTVQGFTQPRPNRISHARYHTLYTSQTGRARLSAHRHTCVVPVSRHQHFIRHFQQHSLSGPVAISGNTVVDLPVLPVRVLSGMVPRRKTRTLFFHAQPVSDRLDTVPQHHRLFRHKLSARGQLLHPVHSHDTGRLRAGHRRGLAHIQPDIEPVHVVHHHAGRDRLFRQPHLLRRRTPRQPHG